MLNISVSYFQRAQQGNYTITSQTFFQVWLISVFLLHCLCMRFNMNNNRRMSTRVSILSASRQQSLKTVEWSESGNQHHLHWPIGKIACSAWLLLNAEVHFHVWISQNSRNTGNFIFAIYISYSNLLWHETYSFSKDTELSLYNGIPGTINNPCIMLLSEPDR